MTSLPTAQENIDADVIIIGAGAVGSLMAWQLSQAGLSVAVIESGPPVDRGAAVVRFKNAAKKGATSAYERKPWAPSPHGPSEYYVQRKGKSVDLLEQAPFNASYLRCVGGTTWHWTGHAERRYQNDFKTRSLFGRGVDWPVSYEDLEPFYERVELAWGVAGDEQTIGPPRRSPFPLPAVPPTYLDIQVAAAAKTLGITTSTLAQARNSLPFDDRPPCCGSSSCRAICPIGAKYDANVHIKKAQAIGARIYANRVAYLVEVDDQQQVCGIRYLNFDANSKGDQGLAKGRIYIIAAHGIETPKLMLMSKSKNSPAGLSNSSGQVGRNLMANAYVQTQGYTPVDKPVFSYRGPVSATSAFVEMRDGPFRNQHAAFDSYIYNGGFDPFEGPKMQANELIKMGFLGKQLSEKLADLTARQIRLESSVEMLPHPENRISLSKQKDGIGLPRPNIEFRFDDYTLRGISIAWKRQLAILKKMGVVGTDGKPLPEVDAKTTNKFIRGMLALPFAEVGAANAVLAGTVRFGDDPKKAVVDSFCRSYDHRNLYVVGTCNYPTAGISSPTSTAAALALRSADYISRTFGSNAR